MFVNRLKNNIVEVSDELDKPGLMKEKNYNAEHSTTDFGIIFRGFLHPLIHMGIRNAVDKPVDVIRYPNLPKGNCRWPFITLRVDTLEICQEG